MSVYRRLLGDQFAILPPVLQALHGGREASVWRGRADVERGASRLARLLASLFRLPPAGLAQPLTVMFEPIGDREIWTRNFGPHQFRSVQFAHAGQLHETVGVSRLIMRVDTGASGLQLTMLAVRVLGMPLPSSLAPRIRAQETERNGRFHFDVEASLPVIGRLVRYHGWLERS
jgi:Domain of unknown function (DUF4166)